MRAFVIRQFGKKAGIDFDRVHGELIAPALQQAGVDGGVTGGMLEAGNVRDDMFRELVLADIVVADVSLHNANVFYELGIRHAVRNRSTVLIRARIDEVPFDLRTDRYVSYDPNFPAASLPQLVQVLRETLASERVDSPVFQLLPEFAPGPHATPPDPHGGLAEDIEQAREAKRAEDQEMAVRDLSSGGIFLSYRHEDAAPYARLLQFQLTQRFPDERVFVDLDSIEAGRDFVEIISEAVDSCAVMVALIGRQWITLADEGGQRRIDDPEDFVRFEVGTALDRGVRVIPVLVDGAKPLRRQQLPAELGKLARLNALELSYGRYQYDADRLLDLIQQVLIADVGAPISTRPDESALDKHA